MSDAERERRLAEMARDAYKHDRDSASDDTLLRSKKSKYRPQQVPAKLRDFFRQICCPNVPDLIPSFDQVEEAASPLRQTRPERPFPSSTFQ